MGPLDPDPTARSRYPQLSGAPASGSASSGNNTLRPLGAASNRPIPLGSGKDVPQVYDADDDEPQDELKEILRHAPAWLVSTVFHMLLLIVLGLLAVSVKSQTPDVEVGLAPEEQSWGTQMEDPNVLQGDSSHLEGVGDEQLITPRDLPPVDDPLAAPIEIGDLKIGPGPGAVQGQHSIEGAPIGMALKGRQIG